jgi:choline dehydrogenase
MPNPTADYVIVGAGTAGCVLSARLSEDADVKVVLMEYGGMDTNPAIYEPGLGPMFSLWGREAPENWGYATVPQPRLDSRAIEIARGKVIGGSSTINAMIYIRGNRRDFDGWGTFGVAGWSYDEVLPFFKKSEVYHGPPSKYHGYDGPLPVIDYQKPSEVGYRFIEAAAQLGATRKNNDFNGAEQEGGVGFYQSTRTPQGIRATAGSAFVRPNLQRTNFQLLTQVRARRLIIENGRAQGVEYAGPNGVQVIKAKREVILCCGAFETPKLMMLSGLGPSAHLAEHGIAIVRDLPGVGANLHDHLLLGVGFQSLVPLDPPELLAEGGLFTWTDAAIKSESPDLQYFFGPVQFLSPRYRTDDPGFTFAPILTQPHSRGTVRLASADPADLALVDPQYLSDPRDVEVLEYGIKYARELAQTNSFDGVRGRELGPGGEVATSAQLRDYIAREAGTVWHPVGTCRMGSDGDAVVDENLRVYVVEGLRIADASVIPKIVNGNPNAAIMMVAEKAAEMIRGRRASEASAT